MQNLTFENQDINNLIISYLTTSISKEDQALLLTWIQSDRQNEIYFNSIYEAWVLAGSKQSINDYDPFLAWNTMNNTVSEYSKQQNRFRSKVLFRLLRMASLWLVFVALGILAVYFFNDIYRTGAPEQIVIHTAYGARSEIILPDNSKIIMNAGSEITYDQEFGIRNRNINLIGEAFFIVARNKAYPFIVKVKDINITALGTEFNVKAYNDENGIFASLEDGQIEIAVPYVDINDSKKFFLTPNESIALFRSDTTSGKTDLGDNTLYNVTINHTDNIDEYSSWKGNKWVINKMHLDSFARILERRYSVKIVFEDESIKRYRFTGIIQDETIEQIMNAVELTSPVNFNIYKNVITLLPVK